MQKSIKKTVSVALPIELHQRLKACAAEDSRTLAGEIRQILKGYIEYLDRGGVSWCSDWRDRGVERYISLPLGEGGICEANDG